MLIPDLPTCHQSIKLHLDVSSSRIPIEEIFYKGKNPRGVKRKANDVTTTTTALPVTTVTPEVPDGESDDYDDVWDDFYDYETQETEDKRNTSNTVKPPKPKVEPVDKGGILEGLPPDIYCGLIDTLDKRWVNSYSKPCLLSHMISFIGAMSKVSLRFGTLIATLSST